MSGKNTKSHKVAWIVVIMFGVLVSGIAAGLYFKHQADLAKIRKWNQSIINHADPKVRQTLQLYK